MSETFVSPSTMVRCPCCNSSGISVFYEIEKVPVNSVLLLTTQEEALKCPKGDIALGLCHRCGFISNTTFKPFLPEYKSDYEETQGYSFTFNAFHNRLATYLIERYDLRGKEIIEIGCGKGEFLKLLCELGQNKGIGFDPAYVHHRSLGENSEHIMFIKDFYSEKYIDYAADFICCKMTLEHIYHPSGFIQTLRRSIKDEWETVLFFQVPDIKRILSKLAFWDIYYEHCSYFSAGSLARLFHSCGFAVIDTWMDYGGQYLMIEARASKTISPRPKARDDNLNEIFRGASHFAANCRDKMATWKHELFKSRREERRVVLWGAGSKAVAFLTTLQVQNEISYAVDINPFKQGTYLAGTGHQVVAPDFLKAYKPDVVILMNPIYHDEVINDLQNMRLDPKIISVESLNQQS